MSPLWLMDYESEEIYVLHQYTSIQWYHLYGTRQDLLFLYVKKI